MDADQVRMQLNCTRLPDLPKLAWCMELRRGRKVVEIAHGDWVESENGCIFEGAWAGALSEGQFDSAWMTGTGVRLTERGVRVVTPSHTLDRINVVRKDDRMYVSNSLPFLLVKSGEVLDPDFLFYDSLLASIRFGLRRYERKIPTASGNEVEIYQCCSLDIGPDLSVVELPKFRSPKFLNFEEYYGYLLSTVGAIATNACDPSRRVQYLPLATVSRGYDSTAALALAVQVGCTEAFTFSESRNADGRDDCGTPIAESLGISVREFGRFDYRTSPSYPEALSAGGPTEFLSFGERLGGRLLFSGFGGDNLWDVHCDEPSMNLVRSGAGGVSLTEYRLTVGFCHLPAAFIGADRHPDIHRISLSREMQPWRIGGPYDRPVARRIAEDAGVPRELFGQKKRAAAVVVAEEGLGATMSARSLEDFAKFSSDHWSRRKALVSGAMKTVRLLITESKRAKRLALRVNSRLGRKLVTVPEVVPHRLRMLASGFLGIESLLFQWGTGKRMASYEQAIAAAQDKNL